MIHPIGEPRVFSRKNDKTGATLVWFLRQPNATILATAKPQIDTKTLQMNLLASQNLDALQSVLERNDGAALISPVGEVFGVGAHLQPSQKSMELIQPYSGTRHTSARQFSYDCAESIIFTVSSDGPISIFSDGLKVTELYIDTNLIAESYRSLSFDRKDVIENSWEVICPTCGKTSIVNEIFIYGWRERETEECPLCGTQIAAQKCYQLIAQLVKKI